MAEEVAGSPPAEEPVIFKGPEAPPTDNTIAGSAPEVSQPADHDAQKPAEAGEPVTAAEDKPADGDPDLKLSEEPREKRLPGSQKVKRALARLESDFNALREENERLKATQPRAPDPNARPGVDRAPRPEDFPNDYASYDRAQIAWEVRQSLRQELGGLVEAERARVVNDAAREAEQSQLEEYEAYADVVRERIPDFDKVIQSAKDVIVKPAVIEELLASEKSALLQYHLARKPDLVRELNGMEGRALAKAIGRLEAQVHLPSIKKSTEAPAPVTPIKGGAQAAFNPLTCSMEEYVKARQGGWTGA